MTYKTRKIADISHSAIYRYLCGFTQFPHIDNSPLMAGLMMRFEACSPVIQRLGAVLDLTRKIFLINLSSLRLLGLEIVLGQ